MKKIRNIAVAGAATLALAGGISAAPIFTPSAAPEASAKILPLTRIKNSSASDRPLKVFHGRNGKGDYRWVYPGKQFWPVGSIKVPDGCTATKAGKSYRENKIVNVYLGGTVLVHCGSGSW